MAVKKSKKRPKVQIQYPPLALKKWVAPDQRRKKPTPKPPAYPPQLTQKLRISSLLKGWHDYKIINDCAVLLGDITIYNPRFTYVSNGLQGHAFCIVCALYSKLCPCYHWCSQTVDEICTFGDQYFHRSIRFRRNVKEITIADLSKDLFIHSHRISICMKGERFKGLVFKDQLGSDQDCLENIINVFFEQHTCGILYTETQPVRYFTVWKTSNAFFLFDPTDHDEMCWPLRRQLLGKGHTFVVRFPSTARLVQVLQRQLSSSANARFVLQTIDIDRIAFVNTRYPECLAVPYEEMDPIMKEMLQKEAVGKKCAPKTTETSINQKDQNHPDYSDSSHDDSLNEEHSEDDDNKEFADGETGKKITDKKPIIERPKVESVTYFKDVGSDRMGIIMAETHQDEPEFDRCYSLKDFCMALGAIVYLRETKAKHWTRRIATNALRLGFRICIESLMSQSPDRVLKVDKLTKKIDLNGKAYIAIVDEFGAVGRYKSEEPSVMDLLPALKEVLSENDTVIITGPLVVAVWKEEGLYYMFDAHERDLNGLAVDQSKGMACLMWFKDLPELVDVYMHNLDRCHRHDEFLIATIAIHDYVALPENWFNFRAICPNVWILQGSYAESDLKYTKGSRNVQCAANCLLGLAFYHRKPLTEWTVETIDTILDHGDKYYRDCVQDLVRREKFINNMLLLSEVLTEFLLEDNLIRLDIQECIVNGMITVEETFRSTLNLVAGLSQFYKDNDFGVLTCRGICIALLKNNDGYFYIDPHDRNEFGFAVHRGKACVIRSTELKPLAEIFMANVDADPTMAMFNISKVTVSVCPTIKPGEQPDEDDSDADEIVVERPLFNYTKLTKKRAILRGSVHQRNETVFDMAAGKQTLANLVVAPGMARILSPDKWTADIVDKSLRIGKKLYDRSIQEVYREFKERRHATSAGGDGGEEDEEVFKDDDSDEIGMANVLKEYKIGVNKFSVEFEPLGEGFISSDGSELWHFLKQIFEEEARDADDFHEMLLHTDVLDVVLWKTNGLLYLFDPNPRDEHGNVYGQEDWSEMPADEIQAEVFGEDEYEPHSMYDAADPIAEAGVVPMSREEVRDMLEKEFEEFGQGGEEDKAPHTVRHSSMFWYDLAQNEGRACILWFTKIDYLIKHLLANSPPKFRNEMMFHLYRLVLRNSPLMKNVYDPSMGPKPTNIAGNWHKWTELTRGEWILRASITEANHMFPECNRGRQSVANCLLALTFAFVYKLREFSQSTVDQILKYGDRLYTSTRRVRRKELEQCRDPELTSEEIDAILEQETPDIAGMIKRFCVGDESVAIQVEDDVITGEVNAHGVEGELDVERALEMFFQGEDKFGVLVCKRRATGVFSVNKVFYMFDSSDRGPNGVACRSGVACFTRFIQLGALVDVYLQNVPQCGKNYFALYTVKIEFAECSKPEKEELRTAPNPLEVVGYEEVSPGKKIIQGSVSQEDTKCAPVIAMVALAMTQLHETEFWTKMIIDEVVRIGVDVYEQFVARCDIMFNPWEQKLSVSMAPKDFRIGRYRISCEMRATDEEGVLGENLRLKIEDFFEENCFGVLETDCFTIAMWKEETRADLEHLYLFDANPRCAAGLEQEERGSVGVLRFTSAKYMAEHLLTNLPNHRGDVFRIIPIEIAIERDGRKVKKTKRFKLKHSPAQKPFKNSNVAMLGFYRIPRTRISILRGTKSQGHRCYSENSRNKQDVPNCLLAYIMDKLIPITKWTSKHIDMVLDQGDLLYKDSYMIFNPLHPQKIGLETMIRDVVVYDVRVKLSIGAPVLTSELTKDLFREALVACFNLKTFCIVLLDRSAVAIFKKCETFYLFVPTDFDVNGNRVQGRGCAAVMQFEDVDDLIETFLKNVDTEPGQKAVFRIIIAAVKQIERVPVGVSFMGQGHVVEPKIGKSSCEHILIGHNKRKISKQY